MSTINGHEYVGQRLWKQLVFPFLLRKILQYPQPVTYHKMVFSYLLFHTPQTTHYVFVRCVITQCVVESGVSFPSRSSRIETGVPNVAQNYNLIPRNTSTRTQGEPLSEGRITAEMPKILRRDPTYNMQNPPPHARGPAM
jgi:hypothetical protein